MTRHLSRILLVGGTVGALLSLAPSAVANHAAGGDYAGTGGGGKVFLEISSGGGSLKFIAKNIPGDNCTFTTVVVRDVQIVNHSFNSGSVSGSFPSVGSASGTMRFTQPGIPGIVPPCDTGTKSWSAKKVVLQTLTVKRTGTGSGKVTSSPSGIRCGHDCKEKYPKGTVVTLKANPADGSKFAGWGGACSGTNNCKVKLNSNKTVKAKFTSVRTLNVSRDGTGSGTVTSTPSGINCGSDCKQVYNKGTSVALQATPASGSVFSGWSGGGCAGTGACNVTMDQNRTVTATFDTGGGPSPTPTPSPSPSPSPTGSPTTSYQGTWNGTTSQGYQLGATINSSNQITNASFGWNGAACEVIATNYPLNPPLQIQPDGTFSGVYTFNDASQNPIATVTVAGTFNSATTASGTLDVSGQGSCSGDSVHATWNAAKMSFL